MPKCKVTSNDIVNHLWDAIKSNMKNEDNMDNKKLDSQQKACGQIIRAKAEQRKYKSLTGKPMDIPFFE